MVAFVDDEDFDRLIAFKWYAHKGKHTYYARTDIYLGYENGKTKSKKMYMHRFIMGTIDSKLKVDHKDGNGLNNIRINLRVASNPQNNTNNQNRRVDNTSGFRGVSYVKNTNQVNKWVAYGRLNGKIKHLGSYATAEQAAKAFDQFAKIHYGEYCGRLNFE